MPQFKPMLAVDISRDQLSTLNYPVYCSPKLDGIRCLLIEGKARTRSLKRIPNHYIRNTLEDYAHRYPAVLWDGEILVGENFQDTTSAVMSHGGKPVFKYYYFDCVPTGWTYDAPAYQRHQHLAGYEPKIVENQYIICRLQQQLCASIEQVLEIHSESIANGYEGTMIRGYYSPYKLGRSTFREGYLYKLKEFTDSEATIIGYEPKYVNDNLAEVNELGNTERSSCKENLVPVDELGAVIVKCDLFPGKQFNIGSGFTSAQRKQLWYSCTKLIGKVVKFKFQEHGTKDVPRTPIFLGFRDKKDI